MCIRDRNNSAPNVSIGSSEMTATMTVASFYGHWEHASAAANSNRTTITVNLSLIHIFRHNRAVDGQLADALFNQSNAMDARNVPVERGIPAIRSRIHNARPCQRKLFIVQDNGHIPTCLLYTSRCV